MRIGDVGIISPDGSFVFAFNISHSETMREINCFGVPDGFVTMDLQQIRRVDNKHAKGSELMSQSVIRRDASANVGAGNG